MKKNAGSRLLAFSSKECEMVRGSFDFLGVIHYYSIYVKDNPSALKLVNRDFNADMAAELICMFLAIHLSSYNGLKHFIIESHALTLYLLRNASHLVRYFRLLFC